MKCENQTQWDNTSTFLKSPFLSLSYDCGVTQDHSLIVSLSLQPEKIKWNELMRKGLGFSPVPRWFDPLRESRSHLSLAHLPKQIVGGPCQCYTVLSTALTVVESVFMNVYKQKRLPLVQSDISSSLINSTCMELFEH